MAETSALERPEEALRQTRTRLRLIHRISTGIASGMSVAEIVDHAVGQIAWRFTDLRVAYSTVDERGRLTIVRSVQPESMPDLTGADVDLTAAPDYLRDLRTATAIIVEDVRRDPRFGPLAEAFTAGEIRAVLDVPLRYADVPVGRLRFDAPAPRRWTEDDVETLTDVASLLSAAIANAHAVHTRSRALLNALPDLILQLRSDGKVLGYKAERDTDLVVPSSVFVGRTVREVDPSIAEQVMRRVEQALQTAKPQVLEYQTLIRGKLCDREARIVASGTDEVVVIVRDITEQRTAERAKDHFVSMVSHELRTPLTAVHGALGLLSNGALGALTAQGRQLLDIAILNTERLIRLTNDILEAQRIRLGRFEIVKGRCNAAELMAQAMEAVMPQAAKGQVGLEYAPHLVPLHADGDRIVQVLTNLLSNAIRHSPRGATVSLSVACQGDQIAFHVKDRGPGIPVYNQETIFEAFQQVEAPDMRWKGGIGLGLFICRSIVEAHGGRIWAESPPGQGSTFSFTLPLSVDAPLGADSMPVDEHR